MEPLRLLPDLTPGRLHALAPSHPLVASVLRTRRRCARFLPRVGFAVQKSTNENVVVYRVPRLDADGKDQATGEPASTLKVHWLLLAGLEAGAGEAKLEDHTETLTALELGAYGVKREAGPAFRVRDKHVPFLFRAHSNKEGAAWFTTRDARPGGEGELQILGFHLVVDRSRSKTLFGVTGGYTLLRDEKGRFFAWSAEC